MWRCFCPCFASKKKQRAANNDRHSVPAENNIRVSQSHETADAISFRDLAIATNNFDPDCVIGEGGFGRVYKGVLRSGQTVAIKQLDKSGPQGEREFLMEVLTLSLVRHPNLVKLVAYCADTDQDQRLLVYDYMPLRSLEAHLHDLTPDKTPLDWSTRMKIAEDAARGLEHLHHGVTPPVIHRDLKASNILLDESFNAKVSDFGLAKLGPVGDASHVSTRVMGTHGYCAPEYAMTGQLTTRSDIYSFGVVLLEIITGREAIDANKRSIVDWARPLIKDRKRFVEMADPLLEGRFPMKGLYQALAVAAMCLQFEASSRPVISDVVTALGNLNTIANAAFVPRPFISLRTKDGSSDEDSARSKGKGKALMAQASTSSARHTATEN